MRRFITTVMVLLTLPAAACGALPAESEVPGERPAAADMPPESDLPPYATALLAIDPVDSADPGVPADDAASDEQIAAQPSTDQTAPDVESQREPPRELPNEQTVPDAPEGAADAAADNGLPLKGSPDGIPWLRLNLPGHTAPLRALTFVDQGKRIGTAGEDKSLVVWAAMPNAAGGPAKWGYERTVRWQIQRGTRGRIYALASALKAVALAGEGAMGGLGEILLIDPATGQLSATLNDLERGHRQVVVALSFAPPEAGDALASLSIDGCLVLWRPTPEGLWKATRLNGPDAEAIGGDPALMERLIAGRNVSAVAAINDRLVVAPMYSRMQDGRVIWRLELYDQATGEHRPLSDERQAPHWDRVLALAVSADGRRLASSDGGGYVYLWDLSSSPARVRVLSQPQAQARSLAFDAKGERLAIGVEIVASTGRAHVEVWNVADFDRPQRVAQIASNELVAACSLSPDGQTVAWAAGARAFVRPVSGGAAQVLPAGVSPPVKVAFPLEQPYYHLGIAKGGPPGGAAGIDHVFDTDLLRLDRINQPQPKRWLPEGWLSDDWTVREERAVNGQYSVWLFHRGQRQARVPLTEARHGRLTASCWIGSRGDHNVPPAAVALGTTGGSIYLVRPAAQGETPFVRQLRGQGTAITSLAISRDLRYLASASLDGSVCVWPLSELAGGNPIVQRWGGAFEIRDGALAAATIRPDGPLHFRGMRNGDSLVELRYAERGGESHVLREPEAMLQALRESPWESLMTFRFARGRAAATEFQIYPAWQQLVTLFPADNGEWAYWSPAGYYDASFEGHKLFGWQINRGLEMLPDFFLAAQFRRQLERPGVMAQLLRRGSLESAFQAARVEAPANAGDAIVNSYRLKPEVDILSPRNGDAVSGAAKLTARLSVDVAERLAPPKAFANGVVAVDRRLVSETVADGRRYSTYEWDLKLPADPRVMLQVAAATENEVTGGAAVVVANEAPKPKAEPRLFLLSVGVDSYRDAQIPKLSTAVKTTEDLLALLQQRTPELYRLDAASLLDDRATKPSWRWLTEEFSRKLARTAAPDDLVVVFLSGHGVQAPGEAGYQFITADARYADVMAGRFADCLSISDLAFLADVPCRKLVILNTCHAGAAEPLQHRELKSAVRSLQDGMMLTLAASGGEQEAVEGRFARRLLEALDGAADADANGIVSFGETVAYVERTVTADSAGEAVRQSPSAGPKELLQYATIPLANRGPARVSVRGEGNTGPVE